MAKTVCSADVLEKVYEDREILLGHSERGQLLMVVYVLKTNAIRIISAR